MAPARLVDRVSGRLRLVSLGVIGQTGQARRPRPERPEFAHAPANEIPFLRPASPCEPRLTGRTQICYPYGGSREDAKGKLEYGLYYI
jgi:hypothetical protein